MGVVTYVGPGHSVLVNLSGGGTVSVTAGVATTLDDSTCLGLLITHSAWWQADDQHTQGLVPVQAQPFLLTTSPVALQGGNVWVEGDATAGVFAINLPDASTLQQHNYYIKNVGSANAVTLMPLGGDTIDGLASLALNPAQATTVFSDGSTWRQLSTVGGGLTNPMTTSQDLIVAGAAGAPARLGVGVNGQVLTVSTGTVGWANAPSGFTNPMTASQDLIVGGTGGAATRLGVGGNGNILSVTAGVVGWVANPSLTNPMTTAGDIITGGTSGALQRLGIGSTNQVLTVVSGNPTWAAATGGGGTPTIVSPGNLGATYTLTLSSTETWLIGTLNANNALTISGLTAGYSGRLLLQQDVTGGRTLSINGSAIAISTTAGVTSALVFEYDGTNLYVTLDGGSGGSGGGGSGLPSVGATSTSLHVNSSGALQYSAGDGLNVMDYGAVGDARQVTDAAITTGTAALSSTQAAFTSGDVGKAVSVVGAGATGAILSTTISSVSGGVATLAVNAGTTVSGAIANYGTDDTTAIQNAINDANTTYGKTGGIVNVVFPSGFAFLLNNVSAKNGVRLLAWGATLIPNLAINFSVFNATGSTGTIFGPFEIHGATFLGSNAETNKVWNAKAVTFACQDCHFVRLNILNWGEHCFEIGNPYRTSVVGCLLTNPGAGTASTSNAIDFGIGGASFTTAPLSFLCEGNTILGASAAAIACVWTAIVNTNNLAVHGRIINNYVTGIPGSTISSGNSGAISFEADQASFWRNCIIAGNQVDANPNGVGHASIVVGGGGQANQTSNVIVANNIVSSPVHGLLIGSAGATSLAIQVRDNDFTGVTLSPILLNGTNTVIQSGNKFAVTGAGQGRATLVSGTVTVSTAEIQTGDNVLLTVVTAGGTRGMVQLGTITAGTSFVINSIQPGTASTLQTSDTSTVYWEIRH